MGAAAGQKAACSVVARFPQQARTGLGAPEGGAKRGGEGTRRRWRGRESAVRGGAPWIADRSVILNFGSPASSLPSDSMSVKPRAPTGIMGCGGGGRGTEGLRKKRRRGAADALRSGRRLVRFGGGRGADLEALDHLLERHILLQLELLRHGSLRRRGGGAVVTGCVTPRRTAGVPRLLELSREMLVRTTKKLRARAPASRRVAGQCTR